jgi:hypothetical protein
MAMAVAGAAVPTTVAPANVVAHGGLALPPRPRCFANF